MAAFAAAPDNLDDAAPAAKATPALIAPLEYQLGTEMVVRDWVLCVSQSFAETLAKARASGVEEALAAYSDLKASKSCGQFPQMTGRPAPVALRVGGRRTMPRCSAPP